MSWSEASLGGWRRRLLEAFATTAGMAILASAALVTLRALAGRLEDRLDGRPLLGVAIVGAGLVLAVDSGCPRRSGAARWGVRIGLVWLVAMLASLCRPPAAAWPAAAITAAVVAAPLRRSTRRWTGVARARPPDRPPPVGGHPAGMADAPLREPTGRDPASRLVQWSERHATGEAPDGIEVVRGRLAIRVAAGCRVASGHVGFCPPLGRSPLVELAPARDDVEASIVATEVRPWGMRIECRLENPVVESIDLPVDWQATTAGSTVPQSAPIVP